MVRRLESSPESRRQTEEIDRLERGALRASVTEVDLLFGTETFQNPHGTVGSIKVAWVQSRSMTLVAVESYDATSVTVNSAGPTEAYLYTLYSES